MASKEPDKTGDNRKPSVQVPWYRQLLAIKNTLIIIITPIVFSPLVIAYPTPVGQLLQLARLLRCNYQLR